MDREHIERHAGGATMCRHCGGEVGEDGYALALLPEDESPQADAKERLRESAIGEALRGESFADGGRVPDKRRQREGPVAAYLEYVKDPRLTEQLDDEEKRARDAERRRRRKEED
jgi:hypothetical protein